MQSITLHVGTTSYQETLTFIVALMPSNPTLTGLRWEDPRTGTPRFPGFVFVSCFCEGHERHLLKMLKSEIKV